jgi:hypothetical protein
VWASCRADICRRCATRSKTRSIYKPQMISASVAASLASMAFSDSHIGANGPSLSSRSRLFWSLFLATHVCPLPAPQFREQTSLSLGPGHIWKPTCKQKKHRPQSTRSGRAVVMNALLQLTKLQYAVIQLSSITDPPERLILAYTDEWALRALIAGPSIVGLGFGSREEAVSTENPTLEKAAAPAPANKLESARPGQHQPFCRGGRAAAWSSLSSLRRLASGIVQFGFAATICIFYSKNIVSATIRLVLAGSV